jgi:hypothetical protein
MNLKYITGSLSLEAHIVHLRDWSQRNNSVREVPTNWDWEYPNKGGK